MATLIRNAFVHSPEPLGLRDIFIAGEDRGSGEPGALRLEGLPVDEVDAVGRLVLPGFIDGHVHILGGGGEGGPATRAPEINIEEIAACGVTTVIGCLGTDSVTRHPRPFWPRRARSRPRESRAGSSWAPTMSPRRR